MRLNIYFLTWFCAFCWMLSYKFLYLFLVVYTYTNENGTTCSKQYIISNWKSFYCEPNVSIFLVSWHIFSYFSFFFVYFKNHEDIFFFELWILFFFGTTKKFSQICNSRKNLYWQSQKWIKIVFCMVSRILIQHKTYYWLMTVINELINLLSAL